MYRSQRNGWVVLSCVLQAGLLASALVGYGEAAAQTNGSRGEPAFSPALVVGGSLSWNPGLEPGDTTETSFYAAAVELPFRFRSPRWTLDLRYRPGYQYYRDEESLTSFDHSGGFKLFGDLSPRTRLEIEGDAYVSSELRGLDATDILVPRRRRARGGVDARLRQDLSARDSITFRGEYARLGFPGVDADTPVLGYIGSDAYSVGVGYGRRLSDRLTAGIDATGGVSAFDTGNRVRSATVTGGGEYLLAAHTRLSMSAGLLLAQEDRGAGWIAVERPGLAYAAALRHSIDRLALALQYRRELGTFSGLGEATLRERVYASIGSAANRWSLVGLAGYAVHRDLDRRNAGVIRTLSGCGSGAIRVNRAIAVVGTVVYAHQLGGFEASRPVTDTYRVTLGLRLQANGASLTAPGTEYRFNSTNFGRNARATC